MEVEKERVGGEESENRRLVSPLLYFTVALLPSGDIQETPPNAHEQTNACTRKLPSSTSSSSQMSASTVTYHYVFNTHMMCTRTHTHIMLIVLRQPCHINTVLSHPLPGHADISIFPTIRL